MPIEFLGTPRSIPSPRAFSPDFPDTQMGAEQFYRAQNYNIILPVNTQNTCLSTKPAPERDFTIRIAPPNENSSRSPTPSQAFRSDIIELSLASAPDFSYLCQSERSAKQNTTYDYDSGRTFQETRGPLQGVRLHLPVERDLRRSGRRL